MLRVTFETEGEASLTTDERKRLGKVLAHNSEKVIDKHYVASTVEKQSQNIAVLEKVKAVVVLKQNLKKYGKQLRASKSKTEAMAFFLKLNPSMASAVKEHSDYLYNIITTSK